jgi:hypothetical protein
LRFLEKYFFIYIKIFENFFFNFIFVLFLSINKLKCVCNSSDEFNDKGICTPCAEGCTGCQDLNTCIECNKIFFDNKTSNRNISN